MSESESAPVDPATVPDVAAAADRRTAFVGTWIGAAFAFGAVALSVLTVIWLSSFGYRIEAVSAASTIAVAACLAELAIVAAQFWLWRRALAGPVRRDFPGARASGILHWVSYAVTLIAVVGCGWAMSWIALDQVGFWTLCGAALLVLLAHSLGGVQMLRYDGPPGTLRSHLSGWIARSNARADAELDEVETQESDPDQRDGR